MSNEFRAILESISEVGRNQIEEIEAAANRKIGLIQSKAEAEANILRNHILSNQQIHLERSCAVIEQQAIMKALQLHADARQQLISKALDKARKQLSLIRGQAGYKKLLKKFVQDAIQAVEPSLLKKQKIILHFDKRDEASAQEIITEMNYQVIINYDIHCSGGCIAESEDLLVKSLNTIESRFQRSLPLIQQELSIFFEKNISPS